MDKKLFRVQDADRPAYVVVSGGYDAAVHEWQRWIERDWEDDEKPFDGLPGGVCLVASGDEILLPVSAGSPVVGIGDAAFPGMTLQVKGDGSWLSFHADGLTATLRVESLVKGNRGVIDSAITAWCAARQREFQEIVEAKEEDPCA